jgi:hypothetical protein
MSKRAEKRKRRMVRAKAKAKLMAETMRRLSPGSKVIWTVDARKQKPLIRVKVVRPNDSRTGRENGHVKV